MCSIFLDNVITSFFIEFLDTFTDAC
jgi:hypothetical protein